MDNIMFNRLTAQIRTVSGGGGLPSGYTQLNYLESVGAQNIDTGYMPTVNTQVKIDYALTELPQPQYASILCSRSNSASRDAFMLFSTSFVTARIGDNGNFPTEAEGALTHIANDRYLVTMAFNSLTVKHSDSSNAEIETESYTGSLTWDTNLTNPIHLFCRGEATGVSGVLMGYTKAKIWSVEVRESGVLTANYIPALRNSDSVAGMYDVVSGTFYTNVGTGDFLFG